MYDPAGHRYSMMNGTNSWAGGFAVLVIGLLLLAVLVAAVTLYLHVSLRPATAGRGSPPLPESRVLLDSRLARGEISPDDYRALRAVLEG